LAISLLAAGGIVSVSTGSTFDGAVALLLTLSIVLDCSVFFVFFLIFLPKPKIRMSQLRLS
jgi:hypothetical protein